MIYWLYRAANDDYVSQGYSFAEELDTAAYYLDNPGFGGARLWRAKVKAKKAQILDWSTWDIDRAVDELGVTHPGAIRLDEWLPRTPSVLDALASAGYEWVRVAESNPRGTVTWIYLGSDDDPELEEVGLDE